MYKDTIILFLSLLETYFKKCILSFFKNEEIHKIRLLVRKKKKINMKRTVDFHDIAAIFIFSARF